jgi:hypothetical protein
MKTQAGGYKEKKMGNLRPHPAALRWCVEQQRCQLCDSGDADL